MKVSERYFRKTGRMCLFNIMPLSNIPSVITNGILSNERASRVSHTSVANEGVQGVRDAKQVPRGLRLHQYANVYLDARNPMMYVLQHQQKELCVLQISLEILDLNGVVVSDRNAACTAAMFGEPEQMLDMIEFDTVFMRYWKNSDDPFVNEQQGHIKCAEVLAPHCITYRYIVGALVKNVQDGHYIRSAGFEKNIAKNPDIFFSK